MPLAELYSFFFFFSIMPTFAHQFYGDTPRDMSPCSCAPSLCTPCRHSSSADAVAADPTLGYSCVSFPIVNTFPDLLCSEYDLDPNKPSPKITHLSPSSHHKDHHVTEQLQQ